MVSTGETWEGFVYVSLAENPTTDLKQVLAPLRDQVVGRFDMACYQTVLRESMTWQAHWKNLSENERSLFTEAFRRASIATYASRFASASGVSFDLRFEVSHDALQAGVVIKRR